MGVDLFFVLSGYLITGILLRLKDGRTTGGSYWSSFYSRRARRILPAYVLFLVVVSFVFRGHWGNIWYWYVFFTPNIPLALGKVTVAAMGPLWSLGVEEQFYFVWPWLVLACSKLRLRRVALGIIVVSPLLRAVATPLFSTHFPIYSLTLFRADTLAMGAFIAIASGCDPQWLSRNRRLARNISATSMALLAALSILPSFRATANSVMFNAMAYSLSAACLGGVLVYVLASRRGFTHTLLTAPPLRYLGLVSYTFYLYHEGVLLQVGQYFQSRILIASVGFSITVLISVLSWHCLEAPILGRGTGKLLPSLQSIFGASARGWCCREPRRTPAVIVAASTALQQESLN